ncbi:hypothetical protein Rhe02_93660 [Rhizocola hellebori]|uniref:YCII-related domain-containing protein n=1 Tax=Rhizocola hellebori TaxID=1392758 RepID=A0A8J3QK96_9ACTN|nr:YciI family protein [Rhizocola hellebori]GIH11299.1 hypothetical protein Rhe02_93660 [Rhizocola hellebori]
MRYMLLHHGDENLALSPEEDAQVQHQLAMWIEEMVGRGVIVHGDRLRPTAETTSVRVRDEEIVVFDGPFAETKEQMGGYDIIEVASLDEAIEVASKHPVARLGTVEVRAFWPL